MLLKIIVASNFTVTLIEGILLSVLYSLEMRFHNTQLGCCEATKVTQSKVMDKYKCQHCISTKPRNKALRHHIYIDHVALCIDKYQCQQYEYHCQ